MIEKEKIEKSLFGAEPDIDNIFPYINKPCEEVLEEKFVSRAELDIDINCSSKKNTGECFIQKEEEEETHKEEESLMTPPASIVEKESLKGDCDTLNSYFQLYNTHCSSQKSQKQHFVMLLPSLGNKQHKVNKNIFEKGLTFFFQKLYKNKGPYFCFLFFCFNFILIKKIISCLFDVNCRLAFDPRGK